MEMNPNHPDYLGIFTNLGVVVNVLPYYGTYNTWKSVMTSLCKRTKEAWNKHASALEFLAPKTFSTVVRYTKGEFDQDLYDYLLKKKIAREDRLVIKLESVDSYELFMDLLDDIKEGRVFITFHAIN